MTETNSAEPRETGSSGAQTSADGAQTSADGAQTSADGAQTSADGAQTSADGAQTSADGEKSGPNGAPSTASWLLYPVTRCIAPVYRTELKELFKLAVPAIIAQLMIYSIGFVSTVFCGHLGKTQLSSVALATGVVNVTGIAIGLGLNLTCDTFISQTYGSGNLKRVGIILQKSMFTLLLACFPCWALFLNTEPLLLLMKQSPEVASLAQRYVHYFIPALPATFMYQLLGKYLQNQKIMWPQVIVGAVANILNALINCLLLYTLNMGVVGSAIANTISQYLLALLLFFHILMKGLHKPTWSGWSLDSLQEWGPFLQLALFSMLMLCLEFWVFEAGVFVAGLIGEVEMAAQSVVYQLVAITFVIPLGLSSASSTRVGNALGAGNIGQAQLSSKVPIVCAALIGSVVGIILMIVSPRIGALFTKEQEIIDRVAEVALIYGLVHMADSIAGVSGGVIRGLGKQKIGTLVNLVGYYGVGVPVSGLLMFVAKLGIVGLGLGITVCVVLQFTVLIACICKLDWQKAVDEAQLRAGVQISNEVEMTNLRNEPGVEAEGGADAAAEHVETPNTPPQVPGGPRVPVVGPPLPRGTLLLRRGLALLSMVLLLCAAFITKIYVLELLRVPSKFE